MRIESLRRAFLLCGSLLIPFSVIGQTISIRTSNAAPKVNESFVVTVEVTGSVESPIFSVEAIINFDSGFEVVGGLQGIVLDAGWITGVKTLPLSNRLDMAVTAGGGKTPSTGLRRVARINGRFTTPGTKQMRFDQFLTTAREPVALEVLDFTDFIEPAAMTVQGEVIITDTNPPTITLNNPELTTVEAGGVYQEPGATAIDLVDGTVNVAIGGDTVSPFSLVGTVFVVEYNAVDAAGNVAEQKTRTVVVVDTQAPEITVSSLDITTVEARTNYTDPGATALDSAEGVINVLTTGDVVDPFATVGTVFTLLYNAVDSSGNAAVQQTRTVTVVDTTPPTIQITAPDIVVVVQGVAYEEPGATATDSVDGPIPVEIGGDFVDHTAPVGTTFVVTYNATDNAGNSAPQLTRSVTIVEPGAVPGDFDGVDGVSDGELNIVLDAFLGLGQLSSSQQENLGITDVFPGDAELNAVLNAYLGLE